MITRRSLVTFVAVWGSFSFLTLVNAQQANPSPQLQEGVVVRDPLSGKLYRQQIVNVSVPTTTWESKPVQETVYERRLMTRFVPSQQIVYEPRTTYVMQARVRGRWNPFRRTTTAYVHRPVTSWVAVSRPVSHPVTTQHWVASQQTVYVPQMVQKNETQQRLVQTELPRTNQPNQMQSFGANSRLASANLRSQPAALAGYQRRPLINLPILAKQRLLPWPARNQQIAYATPIMRPLSRAAQPSAFQPSNLRPIQTGKIAAYSAPLRTASSDTGSSFTRDANQVGMAPTVLR